MFSLLVLLLTVVASQMVMAEHRVSFPQDYNSQLRPPTEDGKPVLIEASINLRNILGVGEKEQIISLETTLRLYWKFLSERRDKQESLNVLSDKLTHRLMENIFSDFFRGTFIISTTGQDPRVMVKPQFLDSNDSIGEYFTLNPDKASKFWMPDVFIDQAKALRVPTYYTRPASLRLYRDSTIRYSSRINYDVACNMDFHRFPVDEQYCEVKFESFGFSNKQITMKWLDDSHNNVNYNISLAQFSFAVQLMDSYTTDYYDIAYPGLIMRIGYHIVQTYIPSTVFVVLGWMSLFIPSESVPGRVGMGMTTLLTLTAMFSAVRQNVPRVSYISYLDIWMLTCMIFVFSCIMEFIVVTALTKFGHKKHGERFELMSKIMLPVLFVLFNAIYWPILLTGYLDGH